MADPLAGQVITSAAFTSRLASLESRVTALEGTNPTCRVALSGAVTLSNAVTTFLHWDVESWDVGPIHSGSDSKLIAPRDGRYAGFLYVVFATDSRGIRRIAVQANGSDVICSEKVDAEGTDSQDITIPWEVFLSAGDYVEAGAWYADASATLTSLDVLGAAMTMDYFGLNVAA